MFSFVFSISFSIFLVFSLVVETPGYVEFFSNFLFEKIIGLLRILSIIINVTVLIYDVKVKVSELIFKVFFLKGITYIS